MTLEVTYFPLIVAAALVGAAMLLTLPFPPLGSRAVRGVPAHA